jgi:hypothetical protein
MLINKIFYPLKPLIPRKIQIYLRRKLISRKLRAYKHIWPIDLKSHEQPKNWRGWPDNKKFAVILTHDVENSRGQDKCHDLMELEKKHGFRSSFNFVPERYKVSGDLRKKLFNQGFEVGVHGLKHDGKLFKSKNIFLERASRINKIMKSWKSVGFRSPAMHHNLDWMHNLDILYDLSTFDTDPFEPQPDGVATIFPFYVNGNDHSDGFLEIPYTLPQDFTLFVLMQETDINIWKKKLDWIAENNGMALVNTHPDYMSFNENNLSIEEYPVRYYEELLMYIKSKYNGEYWHVLPKEITDFWIRSMT